MSQSRQANYSRKQLWTIISIVFFGFLGLSMPYLIFPSLFLDPVNSIIPLEWGENSRSLFLGATLAAYPLGQFIGSPILGALSDDYGRRKIMSGSLLIASLCTLITAFSIQGKMLLLLLLSRFTAGLMEGNLAIARSMAADMKHLSKHNTFGKINAATSIAYILGPLMGGFLADGTLSSWFSLSTPFYMMCPLFLALSFLSYFVVSENGGAISGVHRTVFERINFVKRLQALFSNKKLKFLLVIVTLHTLAADIFYEFGPVFLTMKWMLSPAELAIYNGLLCVGLTVGSGFLSAILSKKLGDQKVITFSMLGFVFTIIAIVLVEQPKMMLTLFFTIGIVLAIATTYLTVHVSDAASENTQGEVMGVQTSLRVLGDAMICLSGGIILILSCKLVLVAAAFISLGTLIYLLRSRESKELSVP